MITYHSLRCETLRDRQHTQMRRAELRDLVEWLDVGIGSRLLLAGEATFGLVRFFAGLGVDVSALDESLQESGRDETEPLQSGMPFPPSMFDAILISELSVYSQSLFHEEVLRATAQLASLIRPGGRFAVLHNPANTESVPRHDDGCFERHFLRFGTDVKSGGLGIRRGWLRSQPRPQSELSRVTLMGLPTTPRSVVGWFASANRVDGSQVAGCCPAFEATSHHRLSEAA